jgi:hypothetical protein
LLFLHRAKKAAVKLAGLLLAGILKGHIKVTPFDSRIPVDADILNAWRVADDFADSVRCARSNGFFSDDRSIPLREQYTIVCL